MEYPPVGFLLNREVTICSFSAIHSSNSVLHLTRLRAFPIGLRT